MSTVAGVTLGEVLPLAILDASYPRRDRCEVTDADQDAAALEQLETGAK